MSIALTGCLHPYSSLQGSFSNLDDEPHSFEISVTGPHGMRGFIAHLQPNETKELGSVGKGEGVFRIAASIDGVAIGNVTKEFTRDGGPAGVNLVYYPTGPELGFWIY